MRTSHSRKGFPELIQEPDAAEALAWLKEADDPEERSISGGDGSDTAWLGQEAVEIVQKIYALGAVSVTAVEIEGRVEGATHQDTSSLIIELPEDAVKRACLFAWQAGFALSNGWASASDTGQTHLLIWRD